MSDGTEREDFTERQNSPFMVGVYLAVNAIPDAYLLVDGPDCAHMKTQYVQGNHDWLSTLTDISGFHRVANTAAHPFRMAGGREEELRATLARMAGSERTGLVLVCPMPMAAITGVDYDRIAGEAEAAAGAGTQVLHVPGRSLSGDWLSGYAMTLTTLAQGLEVVGRPRPRAAALVGYLMDRNEADHEANLREIRRLLEALGLELCSCWLGGGDVSELRRVGDASLVVSLPYGRRAARLLARRLDVPLLETALPLGLDGTSRWLRAVADAADVGDAVVEEVIDRELTRVAPRLQWVVPAVFMHRTVSFVGDPHLLEGFLDLTAELGCRHGPIVVTGRAGHAPHLEERAAELGILFEPTRAAMHEHLGRPLHLGRIDLLVTSSVGAGFMASRTPVVELGYPSFFTHALYDRPFLGYDGTLAFVDRMANALRRIDLLRMHGDRGGPRGIRRDPGP